MKNKFPPWARQLIKEMKLDSKSIVINISTPVQQRIGPGLFPEIEPSNEVNISIKAFRKTKKK